MTCPQCGSTLNDGTAFCGECGLPINHSNAAQPGSATSSQNAEIDVLAQTAWKVVKVVIIDPVEGLPAAYTVLQKQEALKTGLVFAGIFDLCAFIGLLLTLPHWAGTPSFGDVVKILLFGTVPPIALTGAIAAGRKILRGTNGTIESDVFIAGVSLIPIGIVFILAGLLGIGNIEVIALVAVFAESYAILILYTGCSQIYRIRTIRAVPAVPAIIVIAGWLSKLVFAALL